MKEEELIKKLEETKLPDIELKSHRRALKMALLDAGYLQQQRKVNILALTSEKIIGGIDFMLKGLVSRQPVWKTVLLSALAVSVIAVATVAVPGVTGHADRVLAASIAQNSPEVKAAAGEGIMETEVISLSNGKGIVVIKGQRGLVTAEVDLKNKIVLGVSPAPEFSIVDEVSAIGAVSNDNIDVQRYTYKFTVKYRGNDRVYIEAIEPVLSSAFSKLVLSGELNQVVNEILVTGDTIEINGEILFNAKGLSKSDIVNLGPFVNGVKVRSEKVLNIP